MADRGEILLECIEQEIDQRLNPSGEDCPDCGGDGWIYCCFEEWACVDPEGGCKDCERRCMECARHKHARLQAIRCEVIKSDDIDIARAWLKEHGRLTNDVTDDVIRAEMAKAATALVATERGGK